jgi:hypothetical protein
MDHIAGFRVPFLTLIAIPHRAARIGGAKNPT